VKRLLSILVAVAMLALPVAASADSLHGKCIGKGGEKCQNHHRISTSWNGKTASISGGRYELDLGGTVDSTVTVYCDGDRVGKVKVSGRTEFTVRCQ
jgi:Ni/Co efflux regulator RcnB